MITATKRILVVDDETMIRHNVAELLRASGYSVSEGVDGEDALPMASRENPALIVLDMKMARMDGDRALRELRENPATEHIPVLMLTAINDYNLGAHWDAEVVAEHAGVRAPAGFLEKPFDTRHLMREVAAVCS